MKHHLCAILLAVVFTSLITGCAEEGITDSGLPDPGLSNVKTENTAARSAVITPDGGTLSVTGSNGVVYTLTVPAGAVITDTRIEMYPISSLTTLPSGGTLAAGVHFMPEGETFFVMPKLAITLPAGVDPRELAGIAYDGNGEELGLQMATVAGQTVTMSVPHFSGMALGNRQLNELLEDFTFSNRTRQFQARMAAAGNLAAQRDPRDDFTTILRSWHVNLVNPALVQGSASTSTQSEIMGAILEYAAWLDAILYARIVLLDDEFTVHPELTNSDLDAARLLRRCYDHFNALGVTNAAGPLDISDFSNPLFCASLALNAGALANPWNISAGNVTAFQLDKETLLNDLCVKVVIESMTLPPNIGPNSVGNLDVRAGFRINGGPIRRVPALKVRLSNASPATTTPASGTTDANGLFRSTVNWPEGLQTLKVDILASITGYSNIAVFDRITRTTTATPAISLSGSTRMRLCEEFDFRATVTGLSDPTVTFTTSGGTLVDPERTGNTTRITFLAGRVPGTFQITATSTADPSISTSATYVLDVLTGRFGNLDINGPTDGRYHISFGGTSWTLAPIDGSRFQGASDQGNIDLNISIDPEGVQGTIKSPGQNPTSIDAPRTCN